MSPPRPPFRGCRINQSGSIPTPTGASTPPLTRLPRYDDEAPGFTRVIAISSRAGCDYDSRQFSHGTRVRLAYGGAIAPVPVPFGKIESSAKRRWYVVALVVCLATSGSGCISSQWARLRKIPNNPLTHALKLESRKGPQPTTRTLQLLRQFDLTRRLDQDPMALVTEVQRLASAEPTADNIYALAEIAYIGAKKLEQDKQCCQALDLFGTAVANSYFYLFDSTLDAGRSPYDPRFRQACDLYNSSLESTLRYLQRQGRLSCSATHTVQTPRQVFDFVVASRDTWHEANFSELKFVSDFDVKELRNQYRTYGLGVPLIAVYKSSGNDANPANRFYPPGMSFPVTAFLRVVQTTEAHGVRRHQCVVELHDSTVTSQLAIEDRTIPLEVDLTTPLAFSLDHPAFRSANVPVKGLRNPKEASAVSGLYLLEPYRADKIPVVMIHGFWSSLVTWMEMFNDLRGTPEIRDRFQFWFYLYPSGQPFWYTAAHLREQFGIARQVLDPQGRTPALDQMVLIGHSAGGLVAELQTIESGNEFWKLAAASPIDSLRTTPETAADLRAAFFFHPDKSVRRVITIATPHQGSTFSNQATQYLGQKLINLPEQLVSSTSTLREQNRSAIPKDSVLNIATNVEALAPTSRFLMGIPTAPHAPWVTYHNVIGKIQAKKVIAVVAADSDGIVSTQSAAFPVAASEVTVDAAHAQVHRHPKAILEVRRILLEHLRELRVSPWLPPPPP